MTGSEIEAGLAEVCGQLNAAHARLVTLVADALETECWAGIGIHTYEQWVAWQTGLSPARAHQVVQMARRQRELPVTFAAFAAGELSVDQVAVVTRHTPADAEVDVATFAKAATVCQLRRTLRRYRFDVAEPKPEPAPAPERPRPTYASGVFDDDGRYRLRAVLDADDGALFDAALREARDQLFHTGDSEVTWCDALIQIAQRSLATVTPLPRREAFTALFHVHTDRPGAYLHQGPVLPDALRRQLLCDARGVVVELRNGRPVNVGRSRRIVPSHTRRLIEDRDRCCQVPGCGHLNVEIHHILH